MDLPPIKIQLVAGGTEEIKALFTSVESAAKRFDESLNKIRASGASKRVSSTTKEERKVTQAMEREAKAREAIAEKEYKEVARQAEKWAQEEIRTNKKKTQQMEADSKRSAKATSDFFKSAGSTTMSILGKIGSKIAGLAATFAAVGGGFTLADSLGEGIRNRGLATAMSVNSGYGKGDGKGVSAASLMDNAKKIGRQSGFSQEEVLGATDAFTKRYGYANMDLVNSLMPDLAKTATVYNADYSKLSKVVGQAAANNPTMGKKDLMDIADLAAEQGRQGLMDIEEAGDMYARVTSGATQFGGDKKRNIGTLGALSQIAIQSGGASNAAEATESVSKLGEDLQKHSKDIKGAYGIDVKDTWGNLYDPQETIEKILNATKGDEGKLLKVFGERSIRGVRGAASTYRDEYKKSKQSGMSEEDARMAASKAVHEMIAKFRGEALTDDEKNRQHAMRMEAPDKQLAVVFNHLKEVVADKLIPKLVELIPHLENLVPYVEMFLDKLVALCTWIEKNPLEGAFAGLGALIAGAVVLAAGSGIGPALLAAAPLLATPIGAAIAAAIAGVVVTGVVVKIRLDEEDKMGKDANEKAKKVLKDPNATQEDRNKALAEMHDVDKKTGTWSGRLFGRAEMNEKDPWWKTVAKATVFNPMNLSTSFIAAGFGDSKVDPEIQKQLQEQYKSHLSALEQDKINLIENTIATKSLTGALQLYVGKLPGSVPPLNIPGIDGTPPAKK